ncbi:conserved hypothetical protein [Bacillus subtilis subsp. subtilis str. RO-NN-1]|nr:conserved hypothetical protein [Bacillus subtilis subsp. subtilis str. RO-NN-1]
MLKGLNINKKLLKRLTIVPILFICYVLFLNPEVILEEQCPNKPYSLTIVKHGTGIMVSVRENFSFTVTLIVLVVVIIVAFILDEVWKRHKKKREED